MEMCVSPVTLPPGRARLSTSPLSSPMFATTIGIVTFYRVGQKGFKCFLVCDQRTDAYPSATGGRDKIASEVYPVPHTMRHASSKKINRAKTPSTQSKIPCHFDRREKSFLDPSHSLGMTSLGPSPGRPFDLAQHMLCVFARDTFFRLLLHPKIPNIFG